MIKDKHALGIRWLILLPVVFWLFANTTFNRHVRLLPDGCPVSHSHPYAKSSDKGPVKSHDHSKKELIILSIFSNQDCNSENPSVILPAPLQLSFSLNVVVQEQEVLRDHHQVLNYHAPPS